LALRLRGFGVGFLVHVETTDRGLYCPAGDFYVDPWRPVARAVITHAHADHARPGCAAYLCAPSCKPLLAARVQADAVIETRGWGEAFSLGGVRLSLHPAGHILGSAQVRMETRAGVTVVAGDYKTAPDPSCETFESVRCDHFITESTFALPVYRWPESAQVVREVYDWWRANQAAGRTSVLLAYALGKTQRVLSALLPENGLWPIDAAFCPGTEEAPVGLHGAPMRFDAPYREQGIRMVHAGGTAVEDARLLKGRGLVIAPASVRNTAWLRRFAPYSLAAASGWMTVRGNRRREALDRGFILSDHCDWPGLVETIRATGAQKVGVTHGQTEAFARYLREVEGLEAYALPTRFSNQGEEEADA